MATTVQAAFRPRIGLFLPLVLLAIAAGPAAQDEAGACEGLGEFGDRVPASALVERLGNGEDIGCRGVIIDGPLVFSNAQPITTAVIIEDSVLAGSFSPPTFLDNNLRDQCSNAQQDEPGASLEGAPQPAIAAPGVTFGSRFSLAGTLICGDADFSGTTFNDIVSFGSTEFSALDVQDALFRNLADFRRAVFGGSEAVSFQRPIFQGELDLFAAQFRCPIEFVDVKAGDLTLRDAIFSFNDTPDGRSACNFGHGWDLRLFQSRVRQVLDLRDLGAVALVEFDGVSWGTLQMDPRGASKIEPARYRERALSDIEKAARADGDLAAANEALYALRESQQGHYWPALRQGSFVLFQSMGGFFVRPLHPLLSLLALLAAGVAIRTALIYRATVEGARSPGALAADEQAVPPAHTAVEKASGLQSLASSAQSSLVATVRGVVFFKPSLPEPAQTNAEDRELPASAAETAPSPGHARATSSGQHALARVFRGVLWVLRGLEYAIGKWLIVALVLSLASSSPVSEPVVRSLLPFL